MKFPKGGVHISTADPLYQRWCLVALEMTVEYGIEVETKLLYEEYGWWLYFEIDGHKFECAKDLRRALENKAFL